MNDDFHRQLIGDIWTSDESYRNLEHFCDVIGSRWAGSDSEHEGGEFLKQKLEEYGLQNVRLEPVEFGAWTRGHCNLTVTSPRVQAFSSIALPYCKSGDVEAPLVDGGNGEQEDFDRLGAAVAGKVVLVAAETNPAGTRSKLAHRTDKMRFASDAGAVGVIFVNQNPGLLHITGGIGSRGGGPSAIFGIGTSWEHGQTLKRLLDRAVGQVTVRLSVGGSFSPDNTSWNVVGEIPGSAHPDELIVVGAHYDGHDVSQAALDDGAGTMVALEIARALAALPAGAIERTIRFVLFCGEEVGLFGSWAYAAAHEDDVRRTRFMLNLDGAGRGKGGTESLTISGRPELVPYFEDFSKDANYLFEVVDLNSHSDHFPFAIRGIPSATLMSHDDSATLVGRGWGHTEADTFDKASLRGLQMSAVLAARLLLEVASGESFPAGIKPEDELRAQLEEMELDIALKRSDRWSLVGIGSA